MVADKAGTVLRGDRSGQADDGALRSPQRRVCAGEATTVVGGGFLHGSTIRALWTRLRHASRRHALRCSTAHAGRRVTRRAGAGVQFLRRVAAARAGQIAAYGTNFRLPRNAAKAFSDAAIVFVGPVSLMKYGPFDVSITAARKRKLGLL